MASSVELRQVLAAEPVSPAGLVSEAATSTTTLVWPEHNDAL